MSSAVSAHSIKPTSEAWSPQELRADSRWQFSLTNAHQRELLSALESYKRHREPDAAPGSLPLESDQFALDGMSGLGSEIQQALEHQRGLFLLQNFPLDCSEDDSRIMFAGLLTHIGWLQAQTIRGEYLQPVQDEGQASLYERRGSKHNLGLPVHNDGCDVVAFLCRRAAAEGGETILVSPGAVHNQMLNDCPELLTELYGPYHNAWQDYMYPEGINSESARRSRTWQAPIFSMTEGKICARYSRFYIDRAQGFAGVPSMSARQLAALNRFDEYLYDEEHWQFRRQFQPGDVMLLNNHIVFHTRTAFRDGAQAEQKRQLYRAWMAMPNSRPVAASLQDFFGGTEAGSRRRCCVKAEFMLPAGSD